MKGEPRNKAVFKEIKAYISKTHCPAPKKGPEICAVGLAGGTNLLYILKEDENSKINNVQV